MNPEHRHDLGEARGANPPHPIFFLNKKFFWPLSWRWANKENWGESGGKCVCMYTYMDWFKPVFQLFLIWFLTGHLRPITLGNWPVVNFPSTTGQFPSVMSQVNANNLEYSLSHNRMWNKSRKYRTYQTTVKSVISCNSRTKGLPNTVTFQMLESYNHFVSYCTSPLHRQT